MYHNPRRSRSRATLNLLNDPGLQPEIVRYLNTPADLDTLGELARIGRSPEAVLDIFPEH